MNEKVFTQAKWIWCNANARADSHAEFYFSLEVADTAGVVCNLSCDSDYALYVNGKYVASNQYADFERFKIYDSLALSPYLRAGKNDIAIEVWYFGVNSQKYAAAAAGLVFEVVQGEKKLAHSDEHTLSRESLVYRNGRKKLVSYQLGFSFFYDATKEDDWKTGDLRGFHPSTVVEKHCQFFPRPNKKLKLAERKAIQFSRKFHSKYSVFFDLGAETVGLPEMQFRSPCVQKVTITWCEELSANNVRRYMSENDYSFEYIAKKGENLYFNPNLRIGCRYMQIDSEEELEVEYLGLRPFVYDFKEKKQTISLSKEDQAIYDVCVDTLKLCAFEHYVDCPFREQGLYTFDSRNQMLSGYYAFDDFEYPKSNLKLFSMDERADKLLGITAPCAEPLAIPGYSLYYVLQVWEYLHYSGDRCLDESIVKKTEDILGVFVQKQRDGLICCLKGEHYWNFYDWSDNLNGYGACRDYDGEPDLIINSLFIIAYESYLKICARIGKTPCVSFDIEGLKGRAFAAFYDEKAGLFTHYQGLEIFTQLSNSLAVISGIAGEKAPVVCENLLTDKASKSSLSMKVFFYDALIKTDKEKYAETVLGEIREAYGYMLRHGATSVWETLESPVDGGSFCHGWSAVPVYFYNILCK